ncbi:MAG: response regulator [Anaerolineae bacterium]|nr:response regulator [Anaerolineae bacterium]MDW8100513.1 response regulator [Anaerolineae bacterium]
MDRNTFSHLVKDALAHLYHHAYLQRHPLAGLLVADPTQELGGLTLHRVLLEAIEALRPPPRIPPTSAAWRPYLALSLRYVEGMEASQVAEELGISPRQFRREQQKGLDALTELLWARYQQLQAHPNHELSLSLLNAEVARLAAAPTAGITPVEATVQGVISTLSGLAARQQISLAAALPPDLPAVSMDRVVLRQILLNVLTYLLDRCLRGAIELTAHKMAQQVELVIRYTGEVLPRPTAEEEDRLSVAARLIETQGGEMHLVAKEGLTVRLSLPVRHPPTVLVIDDNPEVIQLFQRYLSGAYHVVGATTSQEALRLAQELHPHVITLDVMMPTQDGWEILQNLKNHPATQDIPVIVCSVLRERELALSLGAADFLAKPITQEMLLRALARF